MLLFGLVICWFGYLLFGLGFFICLKVISKVAILALVPSGGVVTQWLREGTWPQAAVSQTLQVPLVYGASSSSRSLSCWKVPCEGTAAATCWRCRERFPAGREPWALSCPGKEWNLLLASGHGVRASGGLPGQGQRGI